MATKTPLPATVRPLHTIAREALSDSTLKGSARVYAKPYLDAMLSLHGTSDSYGMDDGDSIVRYGLSNLQSWRGESARRIKAELKGHLEGVKIEG